MTHPWGPRMAAPQGPLSLTAETTSFADPRNASDGQSETHPHLIGHYRVLRRLDRGGAAQVYIGERADGLFEHRVAIKRVGASRGPVADRDEFETERRALARLSHRNIAQLFDGGVDEAGYPFLIMELVEGLPIDRHVADQDLSVRQIVTLIAAACDGVQHAHQHLVIHAGLNPANILVDKLGSPRIVDFGVAGVLRDLNPSDATPSLALAYASPQLVQGAAPTIQDDVHALGAILHDLLTVATPAHSPRVISPSQTLRTRGLPGRPDAWVRNRAAQCTGDLDRIVMRACASDPANRYPAVSALSDDLRAWCDHRPLADRRYDRPYTFRKLLRRHRLATIAASTVTAGLLVAIAISTTLYVSANHDRMQAEQRFADVRALSRYLIYEVTDRLERTPRALAMRHDVADIAQGYLGELAQAPSASIEVRRDVIESLIRLAALQAGRARSNLGHPAEAKTNLDNADAILADMAASGPLPLEDRLRQVQINLLRASIAMNNDQALADAQTFMTKALAELSELPSPGAPPELAVEAAMSIAELSSWQGNYDESLKQAKAALALIETLPRDLKQTDDIQNFEMRARSLKGDADYYLNRIAEAEATYRQNIVRGGVWLAEQPDNMLARRHMIIARWNLGTTIMEKDPAGALAELDAAYLLIPRLMDFEPADENALRTEAVVLLSRAEVLAASGRLKEGLEALQSQTITRRHRYEANPDTPEFARAYAVFLTAKGTLLADNKRVEEACRDYAEAGRIFADLVGRDRISGFDSANGGLAQLQQAMKAHCSPGRP